MSSTSYSPQKIKVLFHEAGFKISDDVALKFYTYLRELTKWNRVHRITSVETEENIVRRHFLDSLTLARCFDDIGLEWRGKDLVDIGSGGGFPGVPLKIYLKDLNLFLVESISKKCSFLEYLKVKLAMEWKVLCERAEKVGRSFDITVARATGPLEKVVPLLESLAREYIFIMKGKEVKAEWLEKFSLKSYKVSIRGLPETHILWKKLK